MIELVGARETVRVGAVLARHVRGGDAIALVGDLGAGKTTLVGGLVEALGAGRAVSPTFALVHEYQGAHLIVWHVDLYRITREVELIELGLGDILGDRRGICVVEWADQFSVLPPDHLRLELAHGGAGAAGAGNIRQLIVTGAGPRGDVLASALVAELQAS